MKINPPTKIVFWISRIVALLGVGRLLYRLP